MSLIEEQLAELATMTPARLRAEWQRLHRGQAFTSGLAPSQLTRAVAYRLQEKTFGGLSAARIRRLDRLAEQLESEGHIELPGAKKLKPGCRLVRRWHGKSYSVAVLENGFEFEGQHYGSLSQIAREITGTPWSGPRFFGLLQQDKAS